MSVFEEAERMAASVRELAQERDELGRACGELRERQSKLEEQRAQQWLQLQQALERVCVLSDRVDAEHSARRKATSEVEHQRLERAHAETRLKEVEASLAQAESSCAELRADVNAGLASQEHAAQVQQLLEAAQQQLALAQEREQEQLLLCRWLLPCLVVCGKESVLNVV